jgi:sugar O-acyltransferase (sialic acid O-acetyltransferase NeuD family)
MGENIIIIGAGGHAKVIADIVIKSGDSLLGFLDDGSPAGHRVFQYPVLGKIGDAGRFAGRARFILGIGDNAVRKRLCEENALPWHTAVHPAAVIAGDVCVGEGTVVMAGAVINPSARIGRHCIINSGAIVEHDNDLGDYVHFSPRAAAGGTVTVGTLTHIGIGAAIRNNISIAAHCVVGAGAVVVKDIVEPGVYAGVPARKLFPSAKG